MSNKKEIVAAPSSEALANLANSYPVERGYDKILLPRLSFVSQDKLEGEGRDKKVTIIAGTFFTEHETEEKSAEDRVVWDKKEIGQELQATILYSRKQLKFYDESTESYTSSPIYDEDNEVIPLFCGGVKIVETTPVELKKRYEYRDEDGKIKTKLEDNKILYVLYEGEIYQLNLRGSSMYSFKNFARKTTLIPAQLTKFNSENREKGKIQWNAMTFEKVRDLNSEEVADVQKRVDIIKGAIASEKAYYAREKKVEEAEIVYPTEQIEASNILF